MTTIAYRDGIVAADSRCTYSGEAGGSSVGRCAKLFQKRVAGRQVVIATAGDSYGGMLFVDWYGSKKSPDTIISSESDFEVLVLDRGKVFLVNYLCRPIEVTEPFFAIGSGRKAALGAMHEGASAARAVEVACLVDPYTAPPIITMSMPATGRG